MSETSPFPDIDIGLAVRQKMNEHGTTVAWLAKQVGCDRGNLHKQLHNKHIYPELLLKISIALKTDFFACYSQRLGMTGTHIESKGKEAAAKPPLPFPASQ